MAKSGLPPPLPPAMADSSLTMLPAFRPFSWASLFTETAMVILPPSLPTRTASTGLTALSRRVSHIPRRVPLAVPEK